MSRVPNRNDPTFPTNVDYSDIMLWSEWDGELPDWYDTECPHCRRGQVAFRLVNYMTCRFCQRVFDPSRPLESGDRE